MKWRDKFDGGINVESKGTEREAVFSEMKEGRKAVVCVFLGSFVCFCSPILFLLAVVFFWEGGREGGTDSELQSGNGRVKFFLS